MIEPVYTSFADYMARTTRPERMGRCYQASKRSNRVHGCLWSRPLKCEPPHFAEWLTAKCQGACGAEARTTCLNTDRVTGPDVWAIIEKAKGRCMYCRSLAVEQKPFVDGRRLNRWADVGRRIGSLEHVDPYLLHGGINALSNLGWACLWCNVHNDQRIPFANNNGGFYPVEPDAEA